MTDQSFDGSAEKPLKPALWAGLRRKCPNCGEGHLFNGYLTVKDSCDVCGEDFTPQRADDGPAYLTILLVGHIMAPLLILAFEVFRPNPWVLALSFSAGTVALSLYLLPRLKGGLIGFQWAKRMHGFGRR